MLPWLIWTTYFTFLIGKQDRKQAAVQNLTWPYKTSRDCVFLFYLIFFQLLNNEIQHKTCGRVVFWVLKVNFGIHARDYF